MNRLTLAQALKREARVGGSGPTTTIGQTGEYGDLVRWIDEAWALISGQIMWGFLWEQATITILNGTNVPAVQTVAAHRYIQETARFVVGAAPLQYYPWAMFDQRNPVSLMQPGIPLAWSVRPDRQFVVSSLVTADTAIEVQRYKNPIVMTADADIPALDPEHHMMIVWRALMLYAGNDEAGSLYKFAKLNYDERHEILGLVDLPDITFGRALLDY